jgi:hypothetical protein
MEWVNTHSINVVGLIHIIVQYLLGGFGGADGGRDVGQRQQQIAHAV